MVNFDRNDLVLANIVKAYEKRAETNRSITAVIDKSLGEYSAKICGDIFSAGSHSQMCDLLGRLLRNPKIGDGNFTSEKELCGIYLATHFQNYLDASPLSEIYDYLDDLAFWGMNTFKVWFDMHHYHNMAEGKRYSDRIIAMCKHAKSIGVKTILTTLSNEAFADSPENLRADWTSGHDGYIHDLNDHFHIEICPSKEGGLEHILSERKQMLEVFKDAQPDYISIGGYDEGGCTCSKCAPWGSNGNVRILEKMIPMIKEYLPDTKIIINLWQFGTFTGNDVEFEEIEKLLGEGKFSEAKYLISEPQYAEYPFKEGVNMHRPIIGFPEISMYLASPWGGYGANPMPAHFQELWDKYGKMLEGGVPYSEGLYEDINKVIMLKFYRDNQKASETVREYLKYEFGIKGEMLDAASCAIADMEDTLERTWNREKGDHRVEIKHPEKVFDIEEKIKKVHNSLPQNIKECKKWQMIYLRALIDAEFVRNNFERNETILNYFNKIIEIEHLENSGKFTKPDIL